ncbi:MAG: bifunctional phosphoribosylaminoimidazolecarboxamide formyltransferase/IMP cyclohydrolase [Verrucomicrobia bacterium]|nr:bifunctional phosphoribosylaminoimidazolecarboxamide formyltransferase/IMP cyclohydrolase [Verrucomicrobiota bacterium]
MKITRALLSVSDKTGLVPFARALAGAGIELLSTGGTARALREAGVKVLDVSEFTGSPEILDGRVKTLHPRVHGGLLYRRNDPTHVAQAREHGIAPIDLVVVNLYPFEATVAKPDVPLAEAIEQIDIGGPSMLRSAAKNYESVTVVCDPSDYDAVLTEIREHDGGTTLRLRERLAIKVFQATSAYDHAIAAFLNKEQQTGAAYTLSLPLAQTLRYGENPHQRAALYGAFGEYFQKLHGKELSFNNILDISAAANLLAEFTAPTVAILKHTNPCGVGSTTENGDLREAWDRAFATDKQAPFGGIIITNRPLTESLARAISEIFSEVIIAPDFAAEARALLQKKKNLRLMRQLRSVADCRAEDEVCDDVRSVPGGLLVQERDAALVADDTPEGALGKVVTKRAPTAAELRALGFGWRVVKHVKSNAIVYCGADRTLGIGAGQMSRVDASRLAVWKAQDAGLSLQNSAVASDAFFPFPDGLLAAADAGATAAIQPGGSVRDEEVIAAADARGMAMIFTGLRHFRH